MADNWTRRTIESCEFSVAELRKSVVSMVLMADCENDRGG